MQVCFVAEMYNFHFSFLHLKTDYGSSLSFVYYPHALNSHDGL